MNKNNRKDQSEVKLVIWKDKQHETFKQDHVPEKKRELNE